MLQSSDKRFSMGVPVRGKAHAPAGKRFARARHRVSGFLMYWASSSTTRGKVLLDVLVDIAPHKVIRRHDHVMLGHAGNL